MPSSIITIPKFVGTISLGLLTGISYSTSTLALPALLTLPSARTASSTFQILNQTLNTQTLTLTALSVTSLISAYFLSPASGKHPYLLWTATLGCWSYCADYFIAGPRNSASAFNSSAGGSDDGGSGKGSDGVGSEPVNGEMVERSVRRRQFVEGVRAAIAGAGFVVAVVGIWGDGA